MSGTENTHLFHVEIESNDGFCHGYDVRCDSEEIAKTQAKQMHYACGGGPIALATVYDMGFGDD